MSGVEVRVLVVEDDRVAADAHALYVDRVPGFTTGGAVAALAVGPRGGGRRPPPAPGGRRRGRGGPRAGGVRGLGRGAPRAGRR
ncbi:hypothetical protein ACFWJF_10990, partial [Streptomyces yangpuensis]